MGPTTKPVAQGAAAANPRYSFQVDPRTEVAGGGWKLTLLENGQEVGSGVFPPVDGNDDEAYVDAVNEGTAWLESRPAAGESVATLGVTSRGPFRCLTCGIVDAVGCQQSNCPERPELAPAPELRCAACSWQGTAQQTRTFGNLGGVCPDCGTATVSVQLEDSVIAGLGDVAIASADSHPQLTAAIVERLAPDNVGILMASPAQKEDASGRASESFAVRISTVLLKHKVRHMSTELFDAIDEIVAMVKIENTANRPVKFVHVTGGSKDFIDDEYQDRRFFALSMNAGDQHLDDIAVDRFAAAMKDKMAKARAKGRGGWNDPAQCPAPRLQSMLIDHLVKGDPVDVGNFAMMLFNRGERTAAADADAQKGGA